MPKHIEVNVQLDQAPAAPAPDLSTRPVTDTPAQPTQLALEPVRAPTASMGLSAIMKQATVLGATFHVDSAVELLVTGSVEKIQDEEITPQVAKLKLSSQRQEAARKALSAAVKALLNTRLAESVRPLGAPVLALAKALGLPTLHCGISASVEGVDAKTPEWARRSASYTPSTLTCGQVRLVKGAAPEVAVEAPNDLVSLVVDLVSAGRLVSGQLTLRADAGVRCVDLPLPELLSPDQVSAELAEVAAADAAVANDTTRLQQLRNLVSPAAMEKYRQRLRLAMAKEQLGQAGDPLFDAMAANQSAFVQAALRSLNG